MQLDILIVELRKIKFPSTIDLGGHGIICDVPKMIECHYSILKANSNNPKKRVFLPYYQRLLYLFKNFS